MSLDLKLTPTRITEVLDFLGIERELSPSSSGWLPVLCKLPGHHDTHFGSCAVDLNSEYGKVHCFVCDQTTNFPSFVRHFKGCSYAEALELIGKEFTSVSTKSAVIPFKQEEKKRFKKNFDLPNPPTEINPNNYYYTKSRHIEREFLDFFGIYQILGKRYDRYMIIPVSDSSRGINVFEARKLYEYEVLTKTLEKRGPLKKLRHTFDNFKKEKKIHLRKGQLFIGDNKHFNRDLYYLLSPRVLYPKGGKVIKQTLFNMNNLNFNEDLYIVEGIPKTARIWKYISKNVTTTFGVEYTSQQVEILNRFRKRKIVIPDNDGAGLNYVWNLNLEVSDLWVIDTQYDDTDEQFIDDIKLRFPIEASRYYVQKTEILNY